jgi:hypothetical protein
LPALGCRRLPLRIELIHIPTGLRIAIVALTPQVIIPSPEMIISSREIVAIVALTHGIIIPSPEA